MSEARLRVTYYNLVQGSKNPYLIANFGVHILSMDLYLTKCKLIRKKDGSLYVAPPSEEYTDNQTGQKKYGNYFWFGDKSAAFFQKQALDAVIQYCQTKGIPPPVISCHEPKEQPSDGINYPVQNKAPDPAPVPAQPVATQTSFLPDQPSVFDNYGRY